MKVFRFGTAGNKIHQTPHIIFGTKSVFLQTLHHSSLSRDNSFVHFHLKLYMLWTKEAHQIPYVISQAKSQFSFKFWIIFQCHETYVLWNISWSIMFWRKIAPQSTIFQTSECSNESSLNSSCHFWNHKARVYSNFTSLISVMKETFSKFLYLKPCIF